MMRALAQLVVVALVASCAQASRGLRMTQPVASSALSEALLIDLHSRQKGIIDVCSQYNWLYVGARPGTSQPPDTFTFIADPCHAPADGKFKPLPTLQQTLVVDYPPVGAAKPVVSVKVFQAPGGLDDVKPASKVKCNWSGAEADIPGGGAGQVGAITEVWQCADCGTIAVDPSCVPSGPDGCAPVTVSCAFDAATSTHCSGIECWGKK